jgi:putative DNA primase/helicase
MNSQRAFIDHAIGFGLSINHLNDDGDLHRVAVEGDKGQSKSGVYVFHSDGVPSGFIENHKTGERTNWCSKESSQLTDDERHANSQRIEANKRQRQEQGNAKHDKTARVLQEQWPNLPIATNEHPYIKRKGVEVFGLRMLTGLLVVPMRNVSGELKSWQTINDDGEKRFATGGQKKGHYHAIGAPQGLIYVCEGYATGATIHTLTGQSVVIAFDAGNIKSVAKALSEKHPDIQIVIAADNDHMKVPNVGLTKATQAAKELGLDLVSPSFETNKVGSDFNDMAALDLEATKLALTVPTSEQQSTEPSTDDLEIDRLAKLRKLDYERQREDVAKVLGISRVSALDAEVKQRQRQLQARDNANELEQGVEPWPYPVDGNQLAIEIRGLFKKHCVLPAGGEVALTIWSMASYTINSFRIFPKLCLSSPEKRCGKTTTMEVISALVCKQLNASNVSTAAIFRAIEHWQPSLLIDEADTFLGGNEEMRGIINSGHRRSGAFVLRVDGEGAAMVPKQFSTWAPMAIAMIKTPPDTIKDRSLMILLRRKQSGERIHKLPIEPIKSWYEIRQKCQRWYNDHQQKLQHAEPKIPNVGNDRAEDNWLPLIAIADLLGGDWPEQVRAAMLTIEGNKSDDEDSAGVMILTDIKQAFSDKKADKISSQDLVEYLIDLDDRPWCEWRHGKEMTKRSLANLLKPFAIKASQYRDGYAIHRGYINKQFIDAFNRYLPSNAIPYGTTVHSTAGKGSSVPQGVLEPMSKNANGTRKATDYKGCTVVPQGNPELGQDTQKAEVIGL